MSTFRYSGEPRYYVDGLDVVDGDEHEMDEARDDRWTEVTADSVRAAKPEVPTAALASPEVVNPEAQASPAATENKE